MITAWSLFGMQRSRSSATLWRVLRLGLLLVGLLYAHAVSPEATVSHLSPGEGASMSGVHRAAATESGNLASAMSASSGDQRSTGHQDGHGHQHGVEDCALGQPPQSPDAGSPCLSPLHSASHDNQALRPVRPRQVAARDAVAPIAHAANSAVLRI